ncbi:integration host factor subunit alpha [Methylocystis sp. WRRC1]|uniref:integration host factor subunit alpha n=1 Tax=Methylocystis sp. WRRC1 TaxID=1732014 RepID=UPI001D14A957|nr:integration host factor subunit alpha [Methylocystis sp. WRRC1]MCC3247358.1 integration host factor subunit alpha [Methylocystis sp. WRRC1]
MRQGEQEAKPNGSKIEGTGSPAKTVTRADLADAIHKRLGLPRADSANYVEMVLEEIFDRIVSREDVKLSSFGAFLVRSKKERLGRNPKTGAGAKITARLVVTFKPSNILRSRINGGRSVGNGHDEEEE